MSFCPVFQQYTSFCFVLFFCLFFFSFSFSITLALSHVQGNLFNAEDMLTRKPRPMSAAVLRERDQQRARPRSAVTSNANNSGSPPFILFSLVQHGRNCLGKLKCIPSVLPLEVDSAFLVFSRQTVDWYHFLLFSLSCSWWYDILGLLTWWCWFSLSLNVNCNTC